MEKLSWRLKEEEMTNFVERERETDCRKEREWEKVRMRLWEINNGKWKENLIETERERERERENVPKWEQKIEWKCKGKMRQSENERES